MTPDSFYDGGKYQEILLSLERVEEMVDAGVDIIDVGGESSRPGAAPVGAEEELERILPLIKAVLAHDPGLILSVDTYKPEVAAEVLNAGVLIINDIYGLRKTGMAEVIAAHGAGCVIMHMQGEPHNMQEAPFYDDVVEEVLGFLEKQANFALSKGIRENQIALDPGIGFGKRLEDNLKLIKHIDRFKILGFPVLIGASRKSLIGKILGNDLQDRKNGSIILHTLALIQGADIIRVHDFNESAEIIQIISALDNLT
jgi:dihydropteroate synthase